MRILKWCIPTALVAALLTVGGLKYRQSRQDGAIWWLRSENNRLRSEAYRRQATPTSARDASAPTGSAAAPTTPSEGAARAPEEYRNDGRATARAALQTLAWCCDRGDLDALTKLVVLEPEARAKAEAYYVSLPVEARGRWKSADEMVATFVTLGAQMSPFPSADVLAAATLAPAGNDRVLLRLEGTNKDRLAFRRGADGDWSYALDAAMMDRLFAVAKNLATTGR